MSKTKSIKLLLLGMHSYYKLASLSNAHHLSVDSAKINQFNFKKNLRLHFATENLLSASQRYMYCQWSLNDILQTIQVTYMHSGPSVWFHHCD